MSCLVNVVIPPLATAYTYGLPDNSEKVIEVGTRVTIPLGNRKTQGYIVSKYDSANAPDHIAKYAIKEIEVNQPYWQCFEPKQLTFFQWIADYYGESLANVIDVAVPHFVPPKFDRWITLSQAEIIPSRGKLQEQILQYLHQQGSPVSHSELLRKYKGASSALKTLQSKNLIQINSFEQIDQHLSTEVAPDWAKTTVELNQHQADALSEISTAVSAGTFQPFALYGVTGSGKTEVYIEAIRKALDEGKSSLVIVPEIALTPQLIDRFRARLGNNLAILHSALSRRARWESWRALLEGKAHVAIGARSGIFAPAHNLGLIIVDEEHESSYKQNDGLRYNARDLALVRGKLENCAVVLGSATPSLETYANAISKRYKLLQLPARHSSGSELSISIVDLSKVPPWEMPSKNISPQLAKALSETIAQGNQAFLLYNRRGFASYLQCESCELVVECPNCSVTMTYHKNRNQLLCHYCSLSSVPNTFCPSCSQKKSDKEPPVLVQRGSGTEKVFEELVQLFPNAVIARLDRDAVADEDAYRNILQRVRSGETQILVGTQMIAKGHDLPGVTLVGIVDCDVGLHMPDFRAGERVFQLLTQASGRAGRRDKPGSVILQTRVPKNRSLTNTRDKNFENFALEELTSRKKLHYPPYTRILRIIASSTDKELAAAELRALRISIDQLARSSKLGITVLGPSPAPLLKLKAMWRWHILIKGNGPGDLNKIVREFSGQRRKNKNVRIIFDMDAQDLM